MSRAVSRAAAHRSAADPGPLTGAVRLIRFAVRRERVRIPVWALCVGGVVGYFGAVIPLAYGSAEALQTRAAIMKDPAGALLSGPGYGLENYTLGTMLANEVAGMLAIAVGLMSVFLVVRHTRAEEETGRAELVRAGIVGRHAQLTVALAVLAGANLAVAVALFAAMAANGLRPVDSAALALGIGLAGVVFGAAAAVTAQLSASARTATGMAGTVIGAAFLLRGIGDARQPGGSALSWASPIGWVQQTRAFVELRWWPLLLCLGLSAVFVVAAYLLAARRDIGEGLIAARPGRREGTRFLTGPAGLLARLERGSITSWCAGLFVFAFLTGTMARSIVKSFESQPQLAEVIGGVDGGDVLRGALAAFLKYFAMAVAVQAVVGVGRLRKEESEGRTALLLAAGAGRTRVLLSSLLVTVASGVLLLVASGFGLGAGASLSSGEPLTWELTASSLAYLPLVVCFAGLAALAYGLAAGTWWVWAAVVLSLLTGLYGTVLNLPEFMLEAEPFGLVPQVPGEAFDPVPLAWMALLAAVLVGTAAAALRRRDLNA